MTENEFLLLAIQDKTSIKKICRNITLQVGHASAFRYLMDFRREIQKALAQYSKKKSALDGIQCNAIKITRWLELWCGEWFRSEAKKEIEKKHPNVNPVKKQQLAKNEWEKYIRSASY